MGGELRHETSVEHRPRNDGHAFGRASEASGVKFGILAYYKPVGNRRVAADDGAGQPGVAADTGVGQDDWTREPPNTS